MLRGPQTVSELRANCERLHHFADASAVEGYLEELSGRESGALVAKLPKQPGSREHRWASLSCGETLETFGTATAYEPRTSSAGTSRAGTSSADLEERIARLEQEVGELRDELRTALAELAGRRDADA